MGSGVCGVFDRKSDNMNRYDIVLIAIIAVCVLAAVLFMIRRKKNGGGCCGNCGSCQGCYAAQCCDKTNNPAKDNAGE